MILAVFALVCTVISTLVVVRVRECALEKSGKAEWDAPKLEA